MKFTHWLPLFAIALLLTSCKENVIVITENDIPDDILYEQDNIKPYSGVCYIYFSGTEKIKEEFTYKSGILDGVRRSYYSNGQVKMEGAYQKGNMHGSWKKYTEGGELIFDVCYKEDNLVQCDKFAQLK